MRKKRKRRFLRVCLLSFLSLSLLSIITMFGIYIWADKQIDDQRDDLLYEAIRSGGTTSLVARDEKTKSAVTFQTLYEDTDRTWARSDEIPPVLGDAFIAIEDKRFYRHDGVDWLRTTKATVNYLIGREKQFGGSTVTQQVVKNVTGEGDPTPGRKIREIVRALRLEKKYTKEEILTIYLNIVPLGHRCTGVKSAARYYFSKKIKDLTVAECASLATITNSPAAYDPIRHPEAHLSRRNLVLRVMYENGLLDETSYQKATAEPLSLDLNDDSGTGCVYDWFTETVIDEAIEALSDRFSVTRENARRMLYRGGLTILTTVDRTAQQKAEAYFSDAGNFRHDGTSPAESVAMILLDPHTGAVRAIIGSHGEKTASRIRNGAVDVLRPPGSALKPVALYAPVIEAKLCHWSTRFDDLPVTGDSKKNAWPHNTPDVYDGSITLAEALARSKNTVAVSLYQLLGADRIVDTLRQLEIKTIVESRETEHGTLTDMAPSPLALGQLTDGVSLLSLTGAYTSLSNGGEWVRPHCIELIADNTGQVLIDRRTPETRRVFSPQTASIMTAMLKKVADEGTARTLKLKYSVDVACKTGTTTASLDRWVVGFTPDRLCGIRCTSTDGDPLPVGDGSALAIWDGYMRTLYEERTEDTDDTAATFSVAPGVVMCPYCLDSGKKPQRLCDHDQRGIRTAVGYYTPDNCQIDVCDAHVLAWKDVFTGEISTNRGFFSRPVVMLAEPEDERKITFDTTDLAYCLWYRQKEPEDIPPDDRNE